MSWLTGPLPQHQQHTCQTNKQTKKFCPSPSLLRTTDRPHFAVFVFIYFSLNGKKRQPRSGEGSAPRDSRLETGHADEEEARRDYGKAKSSRKRISMCQQTEQSNHWMGFVERKRFYCLTSASPPLNATVSRVVGEGWMGGRTDGQTFHQHPSSSTPPPLSVARHSTVILQRS